jgi:tetratricopeptide (TPR) repeat protein
VTMPIHQLSPLSPDQASAEQQLDKVWQIIDSQQVRAAQLATRQFNQDFPDNADGWFASSFLAFQLKDFGQALTLVTQALEYASDKVRFLLHKAHILIMLVQRQDARQLCELITERDLSLEDSTFFAELAFVLNKLQCYQLAATYYQKAISLNPFDPQLHFNLASVQRYLGELEQAECSLDKAIELDPFDCEAYLLRSSLRKQTLKSNHIEQLESALNQTGISSIGRVQLNYALAKELEDIQQYSQSFTALERGAKQRRRQMQYYVQHDVATIDKIIETFDQDCFTKTHGGYDNNEAIFVLGLPRTGSTLVERIISNHQDVSSAGELNNFALQMVAQCKITSSQTITLKEQLIEQSRQLNFATLGKAYIDSTRPDTGHKAHFIDKLPLNSLNVGLIHLALPKAKIIYVNRHPMDTCYAIYKQLFVQGYPFSYDLQELAQYYIAHRRLMAHWHKVMPGLIYQIEYEQVVNNLEQQAQDLIAYCGLPWQVSCSQFERNSAPSTTASASQVRQGIYNSSLSRWRCFAQQLQPLKSTLEQAGIFCD